MFIKWALWMEPDVFVTSDEANWEDLPNEGVLGLMGLRGYSPAGTPLKHWISGDDWYWCKIVDGGFELGSNESSSDIPNDWLPFDIPEGAMAKKGVWTTNENINRVAAEMHAWLM